MEVIKRRWGILAISVVMFLITMVSMEMTKQKTSLYLLFWIYIGYLAFKGKLNDIFYWVKWAAIINGIGLIAVLIFIDSNSAIFSLVGVNSKTGWMIGIGIPLLVMLSILLYIHKISNKFTEENSIESLLKIESTDRLNQVITNKKNQKIAFLLVGAILVSVSIFYIAKSFENQPKEVLSFQGVTLGESKEQVRYALGEPEYVQDTTDIDSFGGIKLLPKKEYQAAPNGLNSFNIWGFGLAQNLVTRWVGFESKSNKVNSISCFTPSSSQPWEFYQALSVNSCPLNNIQLNEPEEKVILALGKPSKEVINQGVKTMFYSNLSMKVFLKEKVITGIVLTNISD